jgi:hypothetical protein
MSRYHRAKNVNRDVSDDVNKIITIYSLEILLSHTIIIPKQTISFRHGSIFLKTYRRRRHGSRRVTTIRRRSRLTETVT